MRSTGDAFALSPIPVMSLWGPEGLLLYNEAFARLAGDRHPALLGASIFAAWPEVAGLAQRILDAGRGPGGVCIDDQALAVRREGATQIRRFDLNCSPIGQPGDDAAGVLCILVERPDPAASRAGRSWSRQARLLKLSDDFRAARRRHDVLAVALGAIVEELGAVRVGHADIDVAHDEAMFDDGPAIGPAERLGGTLSVPRLLPAVAGTLALGRGIVVRPEGAETGGTVRLAVPLVREGRARALFVADRPSDRDWPEEDVGLVENIASRAWEAVARIEDAATLRRNQARQGFLLVLGDRLRESEDPDEITETAAELLGRHLKVARAGYGEVSAEGELLFRTGWSDGSVPPLVGQIALQSLGRRHVADLTRGLTATFEPEDPDEPAAAVIAEGLRTVMAVPLIRDGKLKGALFMGSQAERHWSAEEVSLVGEAAARLWEALERGRAEAALHDLNATLENRVAQRTQELTTSETRFRTLFANAPAPIFLIRVGQDGAAVYDAVNAAMELFMGRPAREMVGEVVSERSSTGEWLHDHCLRSVETGRPVDYEISIETDGTWRTAECLLAPLPIEDDETQLLIGIARDITAQRQAEEQLRQAQKMEAIGQLTGGIAHDFNNLLTGIIGSLALMEKRVAQGKMEAMARYLGLAMTSANRAAALTHRLLAFSRRQPLEAKPVDVAALVVSMDDLLRRTLGEGVVLEVLDSHTTWLTMCDPHQLENALLNLAINARDAMPDGGRLTLETTDTAVDTAARELGVTPGDYVVLAVTDTGIGMPQDVIARAFDPFFTTKPIGQGTGLGLSMIYGFAKQSDGHVKIDSEVGRGTTVKIFLPRYNGRDETQVEPETAAPPRAESGESVLVVEDDDTVRGLVLEVLRELGYVAIEAIDGPSGLVHIHSDRRIDLLVTDVGLPGLNGRQLAEQARAHRPDLNVLFITGYAENAAFGAGHLESGMQMMTKPFAVDDLATRIRSILEVAQSAG